MSSSFLATINSPPLVVATGVATLAGIPALDAAIALSSVPLAILKILNAVAFAINVVAVSIPGRLDGQEESDLRKGSLTSEKQNVNETTPGKPTSDIDIKDSSQFSLNNQRTLINPSGWAFAIWGPIYLGEAAFVTAQLFASSASPLAAILRGITAPFVAANVCQSLWSASFRPSYGGGLRKYVSAAMLAGTAYCLSLIHSAGRAATSKVVSTSMYHRLLLLPMTIHFGWVTAATLVNLNGSLASERSTSPRSLVVLGNASALAATLIGAGLTLQRSAPAYGFTLAWALAACADGMKKRKPSSSSPKEEKILARAANVQKYLCWAGSAVCAGTAAFVSFS